MALVSRNQFGDFRKQIEEREQRETSGSFIDPRFIAFKPGNTYRFRLLFYLDEQNPARKEPFIYQYVHSFWEADTKRKGHVVCPTSAYLKGKAGFNTCPVCVNNSRLFKDWKETHSKTSRALYDLFKRKYSGYGLAFVISDPSNAENNNKAKLFRFGSEITTFLKREIFGIIEKKNGSDGEGSVDAAVDAGLDPVGSAAFDLEAGYDLIITVTSKVDPEDPTRKYNNYSCKFAREKSNVKMDAAKLEAEIKALNFDKDFYTQSTQEEINTFFREFVMDDDSSNASASTQIKPSIENKIADPKKVTTSPDLGNVKTTETKTDPKTESVEKTPAISSSTDELNVDQLLAELDGK